MDETANSSNQFFGDFAQSALAGLGLGDGASAAKTIGNLIRPAAQAATGSAPAAAPIPVSGPAVGAPKTDWQKIALISLAAGAGVYFFARVLK